MFCHVDPSAVIGVHDCQSVYHVPLLLKQQNILGVMQKKMNLKPKISWEESKLWAKWNQLAERRTRLHDVAKIALVGKYTSLHDSYISVVKSLEHAALACDRKLELIWIEAEQLEKEFLSTDPGKYHDSWRLLVEAQYFLILNLEESSFLVDLEDVDQKVK